MEENPFELPENTKEQIIDKIYAMATSIRNAWDPIRNDWNDPRSECREIWRLCKLLKTQKNQLKMKAIIKKEIDILKGEHFFMVYAAPDTLISAFSFKPNSPTDSVWNEEINFKKAMELAKIIESNQAPTISETVYETEEP